MNIEEIKKQIHKGLIVSCQALEHEPLYLEEFSLMPYMALAASQSGACAIRANSVRDIVAIKKMVDLPVIGIIKKEYPPFEPHITVTMAEVDALVEVKADIVAFDCTQRPRPDFENVADFVQAIKSKYPDLVLMADISTVEEAKLAEACHVDFVGTTLSGYTSYSRQVEGPDFELVKSVVNSVKIPVIAEGRIYCPDQAAKMIETGVFAVVVGGAITRPAEITSRFKSAIDKVIV